jgi:hypothetical protein
VVVPSRLPIDSLWPSGSTSLQASHISVFPRGIGAFIQIVAPNQAILGVGPIEVPPSSGWSQKDINVNDPVELELAAHLQSSDVAHVAESASAAYVGPWNAFVLWCSTLLRPRHPLLADDITVALYIQSLMYKANSFSTIKSSSAAIAFFHKINLFNK